MNYVSYGMQTYHVHICLRLPGVGNSSQVSEDLIQRPP